MKSFKMMYRISNIFFMRWLSNYRILTSLVIVTLMTYTYTSETIDFARRVGYGVSPWFFVFMTTTRIFRMIFLLLFILYISEFPNTSKQNTYIYIRCGKLTTLGGEILYIIRASIVYIVLLAISPLIFYIRDIEWNFDWGKVIGTLGTTSATDSFTYSLSYCGVIVGHYLPFKAMIYSMGLMLLLTIFIGLLMYAINLITRSKIMGSLVAGFLVLVDFFLITIAEGKEYIKFSPVTWSNLKYIDYQKQTIFPTFTYCVVGYLILLSILIVILVLCSTTLNREIN